MKRHSGYLFLKSCLVGVRFTNFFKGAGSILNKISHGNLNACSLHEAEDTMGRILGPEMTVYSLF